MPSPEEIARSGRPAERLPGLHQLCLPNPGGTFPFLNAYLIRDAEGYLLVDCGLPVAECWTALLEQLGSLSVAVEQIHTVIATHGHHDHYGQASRLRERAGARAYLHRDDVEFMRSRYLQTEESREQMRRWLERYGFPPEGAAEVISGQRARPIETVGPPDTLLAGGERFGGGAPYLLEVVPTPGHTPGHVVLYDRAQRLLLCGDHILEGIAPNVSLQPYSGDNPMGGYLEALRWLADQPIDLVLPGHGDPLTDLSRRCAALLEHQRRRRASLLELLTDRPQSAYDLGPRVWPPDRRRNWERFTPWMRRNGVGHVAAHLELLVDEGEVERVEGPVLRWRRA